ncbi:MAG TPA: type I phosphomannose isomerase catalytic subunit [Chloroflexota bacterium]
MAPTLYPLRLDPYLSRPIWGGDKLRQRYGKGAGTPGSIGESWEIFEGDTIQNGALAGKTLRDLTEQLGELLLGTAAIGNPAGRFPLLIKLIDATQQLSIQVHPNDQQAQVLEGEPFGKTEAWYILDADPGAKLVYGLAHPLTPEALRQRSADGSIEQDLAYLPVQAGDVVLVPAGTIHAIGAGIVLYEVQQTSSTTYRLYDWNRRGPDGKSRELHLDKAAQVASLTPPAQEKVTPRDPGRQAGAPQQELVRCPYFVLERIALQASWTCHPAGRSFIGLTCTSGSVTLSSSAQDWADESLCPGGSLLLPAALDACVIQPVGGAAELLLARLP